MAYKIFYLLNTGRVLVCECGGSMSERHKEIKVILDGDDVLRVSDFLKHIRNGLSMVVESGKIIKRQNKSFIKKEAIKIMMVEIENVRMDMKSLEVLFEKADVRIEGGG